MEISLDILLQNAIFTKHKNIQRRSSKYLENTVFCLKGRKANPFLPTWNIHINFIFSVLESRSEQTIYTGCWEAKYYLLDFISALEQKNHNAILI